MSTAPLIPLSEFSRNHQAFPVPVSSRAAACLLTSLLYLLFAFLLLQQALRAPPETQTVEATAILLPDTPKRKLAPLPPPFLAHLIRPKVEAIAPPTFTIALAGPVGRAQLPASAAKTSPNDGGVPAGTGAQGAGASANGSNGNGDGLAGCFDEAWGGSVTERVGRFFYYPDAARAKHATGWVMVHFIVRSDGLLRLLEIGKSSGNQALDDAAFDIVRRAQPLPRMPDRMHPDWIDLQLPVNFGVPDLHLNPAREIAAEACRLASLGEMPRFGVTWEKSCPRAAPRHRIPPP